VSDTPETDAAILESKGQWSFAIKECSQRLERERNAVAAALHQCYAATGEDAGDIGDFRALVDRERHAVNAVREMRKERDQWCECAERLVEAFRGVPYDPLTVGSFNSQNCKNALADFRKLKEVAHA
jgi:hypothetical protein